MMFKPIRILLIEDNEGDIVLTMEALSNANINNLVDIVRDGDEALRFLKKEPPFENAITPDIIFLDINLPKIDGIEVLSIIKKDAALKIIPIIMLTTSNAEDDISHSYSNYANCYITKPINILTFMDIIAAVRDFWIVTVKLPKIQAQ